jgi:hypothetical protein
VPRPFIYVDPLNSTPLKREDQAALLRCAAGFLERLVALCSSCIRGLPMGKLQLLELVAPN